MCRKKLMSYEPAESAVIEHAPSKIEQESLPIRTDTHSASKQQEERGIFEQFARSAGLTILEGTLAQPDPPDILCNIDGLGTVAFELVQLDAGQELSRMSDFRSVRKLWAAVCAHSKREVRLRHSNAQIDIIFDAGANQRLRRRILAEIAGQLETLPSDFTGGLFDDQTPTGLESANLRRFDFGDGPRINEVSVAGAVTVELQRIDAKILRYSEGWGVRAELLAYARWGMPFSDRETGAAEYLNTRLPAGVFSRAWIYELASRLIIARHP